MGECKLRYVNSDGEYVCDEHGEVRPICVHYATSLEEEKAQQLARSQENERSMVKAWDEIDLLKDRLAQAEQYRDAADKDNNRLRWELAQAEAREAAMRGALEFTRRHLEGKVVVEFEVINHIMHETGKVISPDAGRALADNIDGSGIAPAPPVSLAGGKTPDSKTPGEYRALVAEVEKLRVALNDVQAGV